MIKLTFQQQDLLHKLVKNFSYLAIANVLNLLLPLVTFPYLLTTLTSENYGMVIWVWAIAQMCSALAKFGLDTFGVKLIADARDDKKNLDKVFADIFYFRLATGLLFAIIFLGISSFFNNTDEVRYLFYFFTPVVFMEALLPVWYFHGTENAKLMAVSLSLMRIVFSALVLVFIDTEQDYLMVPLLYLLGVIINNLVSYSIILFHKNMFFKRPKLHRLIALSKAASSVLFASSGTMLRDKAIIILLEKNIGYDAVAIFDLALRIVNTLIVPFHVANQAVFPHIAKTSNMQLFIRIFCAMLAGAILLSLAFKATTPFIGHIFHVSNAMFLDILQSLLLILPLGVVSVFFGNNVIIVQNREKFFFFSTLLSLLGYGIIYLTLEISDPQTYVAMMVGYFAIDATLRLIFGLLLLKLRRHKHV